MKYITELHCHTSEISGCAHLTAREQAERYVENGYSTLVITNHYSKSFFTKSQKEIGERVHDYFAPYYEVKEEMKGKLHVLIGLELHTEFSDNDYLIYGFDEELIKKVHYLYDFRPKDLHDYARQNGLLVVQAHPFRNNMKITDPQYLDGMEVFNGAHTHESRNQMAFYWAKEYGLIPTSGSDKHNDDQECCGGIVTDKPITTIEELVQTLKSRNYSLRMLGIGAERDHMTDGIDAHL